MLRFSAVHKGHSAQLALARTADRQRLAAECSVAVVVMIVVPFVFEFDEKLNVVNEYYLGK